MYSKLKSYEGRRIKSKNFSDRELNVLLELVSQNFIYIENKRTDTNSCRNKTTAWENIAAEYNNQIGLDPYRSAQQLRTCYDNIKRRLRRELTEDKIKQATENPYVRAFSDSSEHLLKLLSDFHKINPSHQTDGENSQCITHSDDALFLIDDDTETHELDTSQLTQSEEDDVNSTVNNFSASDIHEDVKTNKRIIEDELVSKRKRDRITLSDVYNNLNEVLNSRRKKTDKEELFVKRRYEIMLETEQVNLKNARMQSKILENNLRVSELELQIKEKMLKSLD